MISYGYKKNDAIKTFLKCKKDEDMTFNLLLKSRDHNDMKNQEGFET